MKNRIELVILLFGAFLAASGCMNQTQEIESENNLTKKQVIQIAEETAKSEGYDLQKYNMAGCHYQFTRNDQTWTVYYELKPPPLPGGHFFISVDDQTKKATLAHGQ